MVRYWYLSSCRPCLQHLALRRKWIPLSVVCDVFGCTHDECDSCDQARAAFNFAIVKIALVGQSDSSVFKVK